MRRVTGLRGWRLGALLVSALALTGCTGQPATTGATSSTAISSTTASSSAPSASSSSARPTPTAPPTMTGSVAADGSASLDSQGYGVQLAAGAATGGDLRVTPARAADVPGADAARLVQPLGPAMDAELAGGDLTGPVTVTFPVPAYTPDTTPLVVVWQDGQGGWQWLPTTREGDVVSARTTKLSWGFLAMVDVSGFASQEATAFASYITGRAGVTKPSCQEQKQARGDGTKLVTGNGSLFTWCFGLEGGQQVLKIVNNSVTFQQVTYPGAWTELSDQSSALSLQPLARALGLEVSLPLGTRAVVLGSGDSIVFAVPSSPGGRAQVEQSSVSWAMSAITFGAKEYGSVVAAAESPYAAAVRSRLEDPAAALGITSGSASPALKPCASGLGTVGSRFDQRAVQDIVYASFRCVPEVMTSRLQRVQVADTGATLPLLATTTSQALTSIALLFNTQSRGWSSVGPPWFSPASSKTLFVAPASLLAQPLTFSGWNGITPGENLDQVAAGLGSVVHNACGETSASDVPAIDLPSDLPGIQSAPRGGLGGDVVDSIVVSSTGIVGPDDIQVGDKISDHPSLTSGSRFLAYYAVHSGPGTKTWLLKADHGWYFFIRGHVGDPHVSSFGLTSTRVLASGDEAGWNYCW